MNTCILCSALVVLKVMRAFFFLGPFKSCNNILFHPCTVCNQISTGPTRSTFELLGQNINCWSQNPWNVWITNVSNAVQQVELLGVCKAFQVYSGLSCTRWDHFSCPRWDHDHHPGIWPHCARWCLAHLPIIAPSSLHPPSLHWPTALLSLFNLCGHLLLFRHPFSLDDTQDLVSKWPSASESNMYGLGFCLVLWWYLKC